MLAELIALIGAAELDNLVIGMTVGANGAPFWMILVVDLVLTALVLIVGNRFGEHFENHKEKISRISGAIFVIIGLKMCFLP